MTKAEGLKLVVGGETVVLDAGRALFWPAEATLVVADTHFGKDATWRAAAVPVPTGTTGSDLARLEALCRVYSAQRLWILGDVFDSGSAAEAQTFDQLLDWRQRSASLRVEVVAGNHDRRVATLFDRLGMEVVPGGTERGPWRLVHEPTEYAVGHALCGHLHPGVRLAGAGRQSLRAACFLVGDRRTVLPAFGGFTGLALASHRCPDRIFAVVGERIFRANPARRA